MWPTSGRWSLTTVVGICLDRLKCLLQRAQRISTLFYVISSWRKTYSRKTRFDGLHFWLVGQPARLRRILNYLRNQFWAIDLTHAARSCDQRQAASERQRATARPSDLITALADAFQVATWWSILLGFVSNMVITPNKHWLVFWNIFSFPYIGNNHPNWLIFFRGVETTNQDMINHHVPDLKWLFWGGVCPIFRHTRGPNMVSRQPRRVAHEFLDSTSQVCMYNYGYQIC